MKRALFMLVALAALGLVVSCGLDDSVGSSGYSAVASEDPGCTNNDCPPDPGCTNNDCPPDPGCTNNDCPPDPGCTDGDCPPDYYAGCCCFQDYEPDVPGMQRLCCCKDKNNVTCRLSLVHSLHSHDTIADLAMTMGQTEVCEGHWKPQETVMPWWTKGQGCGWMNQLHKCGPVAASPPPQPPLTE